MSERPTLRLPIVGGDVEVSLLGDFLEADARRPTSFITNFGDWQLPDAVAAVLSSPIAHLEWFHDTGELVAIGGVPHRGEATVEVPRADAALDEAVDVVAGPFGSAGMSFRTAGGAVRAFPEMVVPAATRVAVLADIEHGPRVHEVLWGWHRQHRRPEGWTWLGERLAGARNTTPRSD
ncbi:hypothetical protein I6A60_16390 [Frankia sp. AgB1.9]|uniref:hypothetical protein n=1 Tax=unclassified Frankia TaxID=2632575 RepID=UPI0019342B9C|nr:MULTISPECIES: hypothetical protein [unclassified Frankia]MBL7488007.1 hypothetical protein [Frankia sp. AgW1.1]MBL7549445.1 hypothetical protein [Frankia sp. AgB1.9]MBL7619939.1 hypothetical protein [Frankia sp. AgB1.8]